MFLCACLAASEQADKVVVVGRKRVLGDGEIHDARSAEMLLGDGKTLAAEGATSREEKVGQTAYPANLHRRCSFRQGQRYRP